MRICDSERIKRLFPPTYLRYDDVRTQINEPLRPVNPDALLCYVHRSECTGDKDGKIKHLCMCKLWKSNIS